MPDAPQTPDELMRALSGALLQFLRDAGDVEDAAIRGRLGGEMDKVLEKCAQHSRQIRRDAIADLLRGGNGVTEISRAVGVSVSTVKKIREGLPADARSR